MTTSGMLGVVANSLAPLAANEIRPRRRLGSIVLAQVPDVSSCSWKGSGRCFRPSNHTVTQTYKSTQAEWVHLAPTWPCLARFSVT